VKNANIQTTKEKILSELSRLICLGARDEESIEKEIFEIKKSLKSKDLTKISQKK
jgi:hypothetical protein